MSLIHDVSMKNAWFLCFRKNQFKKVCQVSAENLSSDIWAWRKYGQKPIKGSPYPRLALSIFQFSYQRGENGVKLVLIVKYGLNQSLFACD